MNDIRVFPEYPRMEYIFLTTSKVKKGGEKTVISHGFLLNPTKTIHLDSSRYYKSFLKIKYLELRQSIPFLPDLFIAH